MRVLFAAAPGVGHLRAVLALLPGFAARGHLVAVAASESVSREFVPPGIPFYPKAPASYPPRVAAVPGPAGPEVGWDAVSRDMAWTSYTDMCRITRQFRPDVIIHDFSERGAVLAADRLGVAHATVTAAADTVCASYLAREASLLAPLRDRLGLPADPDGATVAPLCLNTVHPGFYGSLPLQPASRFYRHPVCDQRRPRDPRSREGRRPVIVASLGTTAWINATAFLANLLTGLETAAPARLIVLAPAADRAALATRFPWAEIHGHGDVPGLLAHGDLLVSHGGFNSTKEALALGVPLHITPFHSDQFFVAERTTGLGVAVTLDAGAPPGELAASVLRGLRPSLSERAREFAADMAALPDSGDCADDIAALVSGGALLGRDGSCHTGEGDPNAESALPGPRPVVFGPGHLLCRREHAGHRRRRECPARQAELPGLLVAARRHGGGG